MLACSHVVSFALPVAHEPGIDKTWVWKDVPREMGAGSADQVHWGAAIVNVYRRGAWRTGGGRNSHGLPCHGVKSLEASWCAAAGL